MSTFAHIKRCLDLSDREIASAVEDRATAKALLEQLAKVSRPSEGAPKLLLVFAKLAGGEADWIDGALRVEMLGDGDTTLVEVLCELGLGMHERVFPSFKMNVPLEELARAVERVPHMVAPLGVSASTSRRLVLTAASDEDEVAPAAPAVAIDDDSLYGEDVVRRKPSRDKMAAVKPGPAAPASSHTASSSKQPAVRKISKPNMEAPKRHSVKSVRPPQPAPGAKPTPPTRPAAAPRIASPANPPAKVTRPSLPRPPALPRTDDHTPAPGPSPLAARSVVAKVPLTRIQVPRAAAEPASDSSQSRPKRTSVKPPKAQTKPPERRSKTPPARTAVPKSTRGSRASEAPDAGAIDTGWDEGED
jgi:hypothetical protein